MRPNTSLAHQQLQPRSENDHHERIGALLRSAQQGNRDDFTQLVRMLTPVLWHVARSQGLDQLASADVVQTTWLELFTSLNTIKNPVALTAWLVTVAKRESWRVRKVGRPEIPDEEATFSQQEDLGPDPAERAIEDDHRNRLWAAVDSLPEKCRILLRIVAHVPRPHYAAIAEAMKMPKGSIGPNRGRCLAKLRQLLMADPEGDFR